MNKCRGGVLIMALSLSLVLGLYSIYLLQMVSQSLEWQSRLMLSRNHLDLELNNALNCYALYFPDVAPCSSDPSLTFASQVSSVNQLELSVSMDEAKVSRALVLGAQQAGIAILNSDNAIEATFGRGVPDLVALLDADLVSSGPLACGDELIAQLSIGHKSVSISGDCEISPLTWQAITSYQPELLLFYGGRVWIAGDEELVGALLIASAPQSLDWSHFSDMAQGFANEDVTVVQGIGVSGGLIVQGRAQLLDINATAEQEVANKVLSQYAIRNWLAWSWKDE